MKTTSTILKIAAFICLNVFFFSIEGANSTAQLVYWATMCATAIVGFIGIAKLLDDASKREEERK